MFRSVLIANRGEIALRIARACEALGVEPVMVFSEADRDAPWLDAASRTLCLGGARPAGSYLDADAVLQAAEQADCQAIHPGYGFLSENALFAARCGQQGITFIGPDARAIRSMGDKAQAKRTMAAGGLPTIPGSDGVLADVKQAEVEADRVGYPVLLKAVAGGGGKGMRRCENLKELRAAYPQAAGEAAQAFGLGDLYLEKLIDGGRHIEFQLLADRYGNAVHLGERECSVQRKHQKLVEESPSPIVDVETRDRLGTQVAQAVAASGYTNVGTVEFLRDESGHYYFMEMNTRLQVEHPVTEAVSGIDLVQWQLRVAANQPLDLSQKDVRLKGHAIELRINAEDPDNDFKPDPGEIERFTAPSCGRKGVTVRWDSAVRQGYRIPPHYDSMIGKLIVHGPDRITAIDGAIEALDSLEIGGLRTTTPLQRRILEDELFRSGEYDIRFLTQRDLLGKAR